MVHTSTVVTIMILCAVAVTSGQQPSGCTCYGNGNGLCYTAGCSVCPGGNYRYNCNDNNGNGCSSNGGPAVTYCVAGGDGSDGSVVAHDCYGFCCGCTNLNGIGQQCTTKSDCCLTDPSGNPNGDGSGIYRVCAANGCSDTLFNALNDANSVYYLTLFGLIPPVIGNNLATLYNLASDLGYPLADTGLSLTAIPVAITDIAALGSITVDNAIDIANNSARYLSSFDAFRVPGATLQDITVGSVINFTTNSIAVFNGQPGFTFSNILGLAPAAITGLASTPIASVGNIAGNVIAALGTGYNLVTLADLADLALSAGLGPVTLDNIAPNAGIADVAHVGDLTLGNINNLGGRLTSLFNAVRTGNCITNADCCPPGGSCSCCVSVGNGLGACCNTLTAHSGDFVGFFNGVDVNTVCRSVCPIKCVGVGIPCRNSTDCCNGRCCNGGGNGNNCNGNVCAAGHGNCACSKKN